MTKHEQNMEVYATEILNTIQAFARIFIAAAAAKDWASIPQLTMAKSDLKRFLEAPNKITEARNQAILSEKPCNEEKYLQLYQGSEDMVSRCLRVVSVMCSDKCVDGEDRETINAWSVIKDASGNVFVTVDYWGGDGELDTYQFPATWLDYTTAQLEEQKQGVEK